MNTLVATVEITRDNTFKITSKEYNIVTEDSSFRVAKDLFAKEMSKLGVKRGSYVFSIKMIGDL